MDFSNFLENINSMFEILKNNLENWNLIKFLLFWENIDFSSLFIQYFFILWIIFYWIFIYLKWKKTFIKWIKEEDLIIKNLDKNIIKYDFINLKIRKYFFIFCFLINFFFISIFWIILNIFISWEKLFFLEILTIFSLAFFSFFNFIIFFLVVFLTIIWIFDWIKEKFEKEKTDKLNKFLKWEFDNFEPKKILKYINFIWKKLNFSVKKQEEFKNFTKNKSEYILNQIILSLKVLEKIKNKYFDFLEKEEKNLEKAKQNLKTLNYDKKDFFIKRLEIQEEKLFELKKFFSKNIF